MAKTDTQIGVRVSNEFKIQLEQQAEKEHRPVANMIHRVMTIYLKDPKRFDALETEEE